MSERPENLELLIEPESHNRAIQLALEAMLETGSAVATRAVPESLVDGMREDSKFLIYNTDERWRGNGYRRPILLNPQSAFERVFLSAAKRPYISMYGAMLEEQIQSFGRDKGIPLLADWTCDRAVVNKLRPDKVFNRPGEIYRHRDPEMESGLAVAVRLDPATAVVWKEHKGLFVDDRREQQPGDLNLYAGADLSRELGLYQPEHSVVSDGEGFSVVFIHTPNHQPFGLGSIVKRLKQS